MTVTLFNNKSAQKNEATDSLDIPRTPNTAEEENSGAENPPAEVSDEEPAVAPSAVGVPKEKDSLPLLIGRYGVMLFATAFITLTLGGIMTDEISYGWPKILTFLIIFVLFAFRLYERIYLKLGLMLWPADIELSLLTLAVAETLTLISTDILGSLATCIPLFVLICLGAYLDLVPLLAVTGAFTVASILGLAISWQGVENYTFSAFQIITPWLAAFSGRLILGGRITAQKLAFKKAKEDFCRNLQEQAKSYRLDPNYKPARKNDIRQETGDEQLALLTASVAAVNEGITNLLNLSWSSIKNEAASLIFFELEDRDLIVRQSRGLDPSNITERCFPISEGIFSIIMRKKKPTTLEPPNGRLPNLHYLKRHNFHSIIALPLVIYEEIKGLVVIHSEANTISQSIADTAMALITELERLVEFEGQFNDIYKQRIMYMTLSKSAENLNKVIGLQPVAEVALQAACAISGAEFAAITLRLQSSSNEKPYDLILSCISKYSNHLEIIGKKFSTGTGLVDSVIRHCMALPEQQKLSARQIIFSPTIVLKEIKAARIYPLLHGKEAIGTMVVGSAKSDFLSIEAKGMLGIIAEQAATSLVNAQLFEQIERMATTDGLTGILNRRVFQEQFTKVLDRAQRNKRAFCLMIADIDHFKRVNDKYGHQMGDEVLRQVARCLQNTARKTDIVARYGGEEFAIIMEDTDIPGASRIAERIRANVSKLTFQSTTGPFRCTLSMGIANYPDHQREREKIIGAADEALYVAKNNGRNQVIIYGQRVEANE